MNKKDWFDGAVAVTPEQMGEAREMRNARQQQLLTEYCAPLLSFKLNIPGAVKTYPLAERAFEEGAGAIVRQLERSHIAVVRHEIAAKETGHEAFWVVDSCAESAKIQTMELEDGHPIGRLFDIDVFLPSGAAVSGAGLGRGERSCMICGAPVWACARNRTHSDTELAWHVAEQISRYFSETHVEKVVNAAMRALLFEVSVTPKPGLVDRANSGAHTDMDFFSFMSSTSALTAYFRSMVLSGLSFVGPCSELLPHLRYLGKEAEHTMLAVTQGTNTHKGLIYSMGIFCAAAGYLCDAFHDVTPDSFLRACGEIATGVIDELAQAVRSPEAASNGETAYQAHGITGVRGEAAAGFPGVLYYGYPALKKAMAAGLSFNDAGLMALLHLMAHVDDTNIIHRAGFAALQGVKEAVSSFLQCAPSPEAVMEFMENMDTLFCKSKISPGGSADLLALSFMLFFLFDG